MIFINFLKKIKKYILSLVAYLKEKLNQRKKKFFLHNLIGTNKLVFDIGSNIGIKIDILLKLGHKIISLEPQNYCHKILKKKFNNNPNVVIIKMGAGAIEGELELNVSTKCHPFSSFIPDWQKGTKYDSFDHVERVKITTLKNLISQFGQPYYCKIDVEGFEAEVLLGLNSKIPLICFEFHCYDEQKIYKCLESLRKLGYEKYNYSISEDYELQLNNWANNKDFIEIMKKEVQKNSKLWGDIYVK